MTTDAIDTGVVVRGLRLFAHPYEDGSVGLSVRTAESYPTEIREEAPGWWDVVAVMPGGGVAKVWGPAWGSREEAEAGYASRAFYREPVTAKAPVRVWTDHGTPTGWLDGGTSLSRSHPAIEAASGKLTAAEARVVWDAYERVRATDPRAVSAARERQEAAEARAVVLEATRRVPAGTRKEDWLPFVTAVLRHLGHAQSLALAADDTAASFGIAGEQTRYLADFRRLTGRDFDLATDRVTREEVEALPVTPPAPAKAAVYECLECGATYPPEKAHLIDPGGMGCARCNH